jgi:hypothetical protein
MQLQPENPRPFILSPGAFHHVCLLGGGCDDLILLVGLEHVPEFMRTLESTHDWRHQASRIHGRFTVTKRSFSAVALVVVALDCHACSVMQVHCGKRRPCRRTSVRVWTMATRACRPKVFPANTCPRISHGPKLRAARPKRRYRGTARVLARQQAAQHLT